MQKISNGFISPQMSHNFHTRFFFPSNALWLSPGQIVKQAGKPIAYLQIQRINAMATSIILTMCIEKRTEFGSIHDPLSSHRARRMIACISHTSRLWKLDQNNTTKKDHFLDSKRRKARSQGLSKLLEASSGGSTARQHLNDSCGSEMLCLPVWKTIL